MRRLAVLSAALALAVQAGGCIGADGYGPGRYDYDTPYGYGPGWGYGRDAYAGRPRYDGRSMPDRRRWDRDRDRAWTPPVATRPLPSPPAAAFRPPPSERPAQFNPPVWHQGRWIGPMPRDDTPPTE
jgi:hypothetical protein